MDYIDVQGATDYFGNTDWAVTEKPERCVILANLWLSNKGLPKLNPIPDEWKDAGYEIAYEIGKGSIYADRQTVTAEPEINDLINGFTVTSVSSDPAKVTYTVQLRNQ